MPSTRLHGPYLLTSEGIDTHVDQVGIGAYALGYVGTDGTFHVQRIGRSDDNLNNRLHQYLPLKKYRTYKYGFLGTSKECYEYECKIWHAFRPKNNPNHPDTPDGTNYPCPVPNCTRL